MLVEHWPLIVLVALLVIASVTDLMYGKILNVVTYPAILIGLAGHTLMGGLTGEGHWIGLAGSLGGLAMGGLPMLVGFLAGGINGGDLKVTAAIGALTGWEFTLNTLFFGLSVAVVMSLAVMLYRRVFWQTLKRVGRFLYLAITPTKPADPATPESPKIPLGLAMCIGAGIVVAIDLCKGGSMTRLLFG